MNIEQMRKAFEAWCKEELSDDLSRHRLGGYEAEDVHHTWCAWQAASAAIQRDAMAVAEAVRDAAIQCLGVGAKQGWSRQSIACLDLAAIVEAVRPENTSDLPSDASDLNANSSEIQPEMREALNIANYLWRTFYAEEAPHWKPFDNVRGLLTQIDNMVSGISKPAAAEAVQPASAQQQGEPVAYMIDWPDEPELGHYFAEEPTDTGCCRALYTTPPVPACSLPEGYALVPVKPTEVMCLRGCEVSKSPTVPAEVWSAMLAAAPKPEGYQQ